jgi:hypothetical protein
MVQFRQAAAPSRGFDKSLKEIFMKQSIMLAAALALAVSTSAFATSHKEAPGMAASGAMTQQQSKMGDCNKSAGDKKGDERKAFMKTCLSAGGTAAAAATPMTQQDKMKKCNVDATGKKGDERKAFMKTCLSS